PAAEVINCQCMAIGKRLIGKGADARCESDAEAIGRCLTRRSVTYAEVMSLRDRRAETPAENPLAVSQPPDTQDKDDGGTDE
ncbi:MAG TPA: hypothetical protein VMW52_07430, partial [Phycisphaerae bacterium]|nr:hypothetical protein [Phycisphaerae bacterium]